MVFSVGLAGLVWVIFMDSSWAARSTGQHIDVGSIVRKAVGDSFLKNA